MFRQSMDTMDDKKTVPGKHTEIRGIFDKDDVRTTYLKTSL